MSCCFCLDICKIRSISAILWVQCNSVLSKSVDAIQKKFETSDKVNNVTLCKLLIPNAIQSRCRSLFAFFDEYNSCSRLRHSFFVGSYSISSVWLIPTKCLTGYKPPATTEGTACVLFALRTILKTKLCVIWIFPFSELRCKKTSKLSFTFAVPKFVSTALLV